VSLVWREKMSVANTLIDTEHKYLIKQINAVEPAINTKENHDIVTETLEHLVSYTKTHFDHEETIQRKIQYPQSEEHKLEHKKIMQKLYAIKNKLDEILNTEQSKVSDDTEDLLDSSLNSLLEDNEKDHIHSVTANDLDPLVLLIRSWVIDHVIGSDMNMKPYLLKRPMDFQ